MKTCPQCDQSFNDDTLNFCLIDGTPLVATESQPTIVMPGKGVETVVIPPAVETVSAAKKSSSTLWIVIAVSALTMLVVTVVAGGFLFYFYTGSRDNVPGNRKSAVTSPPAPKVSATPKFEQLPAPSPVAERPLPPDVTSSDTNADEANEITPIAWNTIAVTFNGASGKVYEFECPENGTSFPVWGSDVYTGDSSICTAAVHAGEITLEDGGYVSVEFRPGRSTYGSTTRNGITTSTFGQYHISFVVR